MNMFKYISALNFVVKQTDKCQMSRQRHRSSRTHILTLCLIFIQCVHGDQRTEVSHRDHIECMNSIVDRSAFNQNCIELSPIHFLFSKEQEKKKEIESGIKGKSDESSSKG